MNFRRFFIAFLAAVLFALPALAEYNRLEVPDSSGIRTEIAENWFEVPLSALREKRPELRENEAGVEFQIRMEETDDMFSVIVAPETAVAVDFYTETGITTKIVSEYPADTAGAWILMRDSGTGKPLHIRYYFAADSDVYVQFSPAGNKTVADFIVFGCFATRNTQVGVPFSRFYTASFADVLSLTEYSLPWRYADIFPGQYKNNLRMIETIRKNLHRISYSWDACYDENDNPVEISTGKIRDVDAEDEKENRITMNHAGFLKWIIDGLVKPLTGSAMYLDPLLRPTVSVNPLGYSGIIGEKENLSFTLDWTRNLAAARLSILTRRTYLYENSGVDVTVEPFSAEVGKDGIRSVAGYIQNTGYEIKNMKPLLYVLGASEPGYFYLAAIRRRVPPFNGLPEYYVFDRSAVIFPYFDNDGYFGCTVFEDGIEMTLSQFVGKYEDSYVHLTRVLSSDRFAPL